MMPFRTQDIPCSVANDLVKFSSLSLPNCRAALTDLSNNNLVTEGGPERARRIGDRAVQPYIRTSHFNFIWRTMNRRRLAVLDLSDTAVLSRPTYQ